MRRLHAAKPNNRAALPRSRATVSLALAFLSVSIACAGWDQTMVFGWFAKKKAKRDLNSLTEAALNMAAAYGDYLEDNPVGMQVTDVSLLPHHKETILNALCFLLATRDGSQWRAATELNASHLANFQKGIGEHPLDPISLSPAILSNPTLTGAALSALATRNPAGKKRFDELSAIVQADIRRIEDRIAQANVLYRQRAR